MPALSEQRKQRQQADRKAAGHAAEKSHQKAESYKEVKKYSRRDFCHARLFFFLRVSFRFLLSSLFFDFSFSCVQKQDNHCCN